MERVEYSCVTQVAQIYQSIEFSRLTTLVPFVDAFQLERAIVDAARHCDLQVSAVAKNIKCLYTFLYLDKSD